MSVIVMYLIEILYVDSSRTFLIFAGSDDEGPSNGVVSHNSSLDETKKRNDVAASTSITSSSSANNVTCYRFGSVGQDTLICLWDITEDILKQSAAAHSKACQVKLFER